MLSGLVMRESFVLSLMLRAFKKKMYITIEFLLTWDKGALVAMKAFHRGRPSATSEYIQDLVSLL